MTDTRMHRPVLVTSAQDPSFDAEAALQDLAAAGAATGGDALLLRVLLLRRYYPDAVIQSDLIRDAEDLAIVRVTVTLPTGAAASAFASGPRDDLRQIETEAIGHALDLLGHMLVLHRPASTPEPDNEPDAPAEPAVPVPIRSSVTPARREAPATRTVPPTPETDESPPTVIDAVRRANLRRHAPPPRSVANDAARAGRPGDPAPEEPPLEDYSWTAFWRAARPLGLDKVKVEELIGRSLEGMNPGDVRAALIAAGVDF